MEHVSHATYYEISMIRPGPPPLQAQVVEANFINAAVTVTEIERQHPHLLYMYVVEAY
jgi:hypothetical protein